MHGGAPEFLHSLALVLCVAALTSVIFQRLHQPVVLGYLLAGMLVSPHTPVPLFADEATTHTLSEFGVILLMFSLGLEFSLGRLLRAGASAVLVGVVQCSLMMWLGYVTAQLFGWTTLESVYAGAIIAISSTTIIVKAFEEQGVRGRLTDIVFGVLIIEDLIAILLIAVLTALSTGAGLSAASLAITAARLAAFLVAMLVGGMLIVPRVMRMVVGLRRPETTVVASVGLSFAFALIAAAAGYSVALGAFLAGALVGESGVEREVEHRVQPVRDVFAAVFFVSVGMLIDPAADRPALGGGAGVHGRGRRRQGGGSRGRRVSHRPGHPPLGPGRHEPGTDRRVLVHHRRRRRRARRDRRRSSIRSRSRCRRRPRC